MEKFTKNNANRNNDNKKPAPITLTEPLLYLKDKLFNDIHAVATMPEHDIEPRKVWNYGGNMSDVPFGGVEFWTVNRYVTRSNDTYDFTGVTLNIIVLTNHVPTHNVTAKYDHTNRRVQLGVVEIDPSRGPIGRTRYKDSETY